MSHATVLVIGTGIAKQMAPYSENKVMKPYKSYLKIEDIQRMKEHYKVDKESDLAQHMEDWSGQKGGVDKKGIFRWSTYNPKSKWDWFQEGGRWAGMFTLVKGKTGKRGSKSLLMDEDPYKEGGVGSAMIKNLDPEKLKSLTTFAVLNKSGWHEAGQMGWWGISDNSGCTEIPQSFTQVEFDKNHDPSWIKKEYIDKVIVARDKYYDCNKGVYTIKKGMKAGKDILEHTFFTEKAWDEAYYDRFLKDLSPDTRITVVDYHI